MKVNVTATRCIVENDVELNAGEYNINKFYFTFSPEYIDNYVKKALFVAKDKPPIEMVIANDECDIPYDILKKPGVYMVGVYAYEIDENNELILRYSPEPTHFYVNRGSYIENAETPTEPDPDEFAQYYQAMQELVANAKPELIDYIEDNLPTIHVGETSTLTPGTPATVTNVGTERNPIFDFGIPQGLPGTTDYNELVNKPDLTVFALITESANKIALEMDPTEFKIKAKISDKNNRLISESNVIDLPLESVVVSGEYDTTNKKIILTLENGNVIEIPIEDLIDGLATKTELEEGLATKDANIIESISKNGVPLPVNANKNVNITVPTRTSEIINDSGFITNDTNGLSHYYNKTASDTRFSLVNETGSNFTLSIDPTTFVMTATLKDKNGRALSIQTVDLPLESVVVGGRYDSETREVVLTLENGSVVRFSVADLVSGLQTEITENNKLNADFVDDSNADNKFVTTTEKNTWNNKQSEITNENKLNSDLVDDTNSTNKFVTNQEKTTWNNKSDFSGSYNDLTNKPDLTIYEEKTNKVTSLSSSSTDTQYPSGKCVYDSQEEQNSEIDRLKMLYNILPTTSGSGTDITLDGTGKVTLKNIDLKGNTSQETTTGKNLLDTSLLPIEQDGLKIFKNDKGEIVINGTPNWSSGYHSFVIGNTSTSEETTYTLSMTNKRAGLGIAIGNGNINITMADETSSKTYTFINSFVINPQLNINYNAGTFNNVVINPQLEKSSSKTDYEPYVGGVPSPNPNYPQDIYVVSGDNTIKVEGKNFFDKDNEIVFGKFYTNTGEIGTDSGLFLQESYIKVEPNSEYTFSSNNNDYFRMCEYDANKTFIQRQILSQGNANISTYTTTSTTEYIRISCNNTNFNTLQLEKGSTATTYQPYQSQTYPINLPVENLFDNTVEKKNAYATGNVGQTIGYTNSTSSVTYVKCTYLKARQTYTISWKKNTPASIAVRGSMIIDDNNLILEKIDIWTNNDNIYTFTPTYNGYLIFVMDKNTTNIQLEKGSKANHYTPYGTTPIELCKIGNYKDYFRISSGKNMFNSTIQAGTYTGSSSSTVYTVSSDGKITQSATDNSGFSISQDRSFTLPAGTYTATIIGKSSSTNFQIRNITDGTDLIKSTNDTVTFTLSSEKVVALKTYSSTNTYPQSYYIQIEKGTSATSYEPYGKVWYKYGAIGKVVLNGSESWNLKEIYQGISQFQIAKTDVSYTNDGVVRILSNYFNGVGYSQSWVKDNSITIANALIRIMISSISTTENFKTWLSTHNTTVYYVLATPTYTQITDTTLISQLNAIEKAYSYATQTNITQENNDLPFKIDATAISDIDLSDYVKNTDYATDTKGGTIKSRSTHGFNVADGQPYTSTYDYTTYQDKPNSIFIGKGTLENVITGKGLTTKAYVDNAIEDNSIDVQVNNTSIVSNNVANISVTGSYSVSPLLSLWDVMIDDSIPLGADEDSIRINTTSGNYDGTSVLLATNDTLESDYVPIAADAAMQGTNYSSSINNVGYQIEFGLTNNTSGDSNSILLTPTETYIGNVRDPENDGDAVNKKYVDDAVISASPTDVQINGTSIVSSNVANILTEGVYGVRNKLLTKGYADARYVLEETIDDNVGYMYISPNIKDDKDVDFSINAQSNLDSEAFADMNFGVEYDENEDKGHGYFRLSLYDAGSIEIDNTGTKITNVITPTNDGDAVNKLYVDNLVGDIESILTTLDVGGGA